MPRHAFAEVINGMGDASSSASAIVFIALHVVAVLRVSAGTPLCGGTDPARPGAEVGCVRGGVGATEVASPPSA